MRIRTKKYTQEELEHSKFIIKNPLSHKGNWDKHFDNNNPLHIEIGSGKGKFITTLSQQNPYINFVALERADKILARATKKASNLEESCGQINNLKFILGDASTLLDIFDKEIERIYLNFSDPWPNRKKWQKKRLTHRNFLNIYTQILKPMGQIHFKTDNKELFEFSLLEFKDMGWDLEDITQDLHNTAYHTSGNNIMTEYETKFAASGICRLVATQN